MFIKSLKLCWLYCIYRDNIEYRDNFLDDGRDTIFLISPNSILVQVRAASKSENLATEIEMNKRLVEF